MRVTLECMVSTRPNFTSGAHYTGDKVGLNGYRIVDDNGTKQLVSANGSYKSGFRVVKTALYNSKLSNRELPELTRNLIDGANDFSQFTKLIEEAGELAGNISRGKDVRDDIGDMVVVLINIAERHGYTLEDCLEVAWNDIKDRRGKMVNGTFIKEADLR